MRNVLVAGLGLSPAVVTETLWTLAHRRRDGGPAPFIVDEVHILTTERGRASVEQRLDGDHGGLALFCREYLLPRPKLLVHLAKDGQGEPLSDIRTEADSVRLADAAVALVGELAEHDDLRIHASMAGGRKTMSFYMGYVMSLFGRAQDGLSHVLVHDERYEFCPDFWYPTKAPRVVAYEDRTTGRKVELDAAQARLDLTEIPFVRLRDHLPAELRTQLREQGFAAVVHALEEALLPPRLVLFDRTREVQAGRRRFPLPQRDYVMYRLLAEVARDQRPGAGPDGVGPSQRGWLTAADFAEASGPTVGRFLELYRALAPLEGAALEGFAGRLSAIQKLSDTADRMEETKRLFSEVRAKLNDSLKHALPDPTLRMPFMVHRGPRGGTQPSRFGLILKPEQIEIVREQPA